MKSRHLVQLTCILATSLTTISRAEDEAANTAAAPITWTAGGKPSEGMDVLFVQNASEVSLKDGKLILSDVQPSTVCFTDRPARLAGSMPTAAFIPLWNTGKDSFLKDPPNANLSVFKDGEVSDLVVELSNPTYDGDTLTYDVKVLEGDPAIEGGACSLFIDVIGMPRTPYSYAGAARRAWRR
jgi:hypothetical protein